MSPVFLFPHGTKVRVRTERTLVGITQGEPRNISGEYWYVVFFGPGNESRRPESNLELYEGGTDPDSLLLSGSWGEKETLSKIVSYTKLSTPLRNSIYAFHSSRTRFYPFQFKPLMKFLDSPKQRLLISDEVGLGKTIEAGLIIVEQRARQALQRILIVCPASLCGKWHEEMLRRFDEEFAVLDTRGFRNFLRELERKGESTRLRGICSLQTLRSRGMLEDLRAASPPLDLVIVDEAHHMRNSGTLTHQLGETLTDSADGMLMLTATPVHLGNINLFNLLKILDPEGMDDYAVFEQRIRANEHVISAQRMLGTELPCDLHSIERKLLEVETTPERSRFLANPIYHDVLRRLREYDGSRRDHVVELQRDMASINVLSHILTRTRKSEVHENRAVRTARVISVTPAPEEMDFYHLVTNYVTGKYGEYSGTVGVLAAITVQRQLASCMPAMAEHYLDSVIPAGLGLDSEMSSEDVEDWLEDADENGEEAGKVRREIRDLVSSGRILRLEKVDSKFTELVGKLHSLEKEEPGRKVIIFSYFKRTLAYLARRLKAEGFSCLTLSGDVPSRPREPDKDERGRILREFRGNPEARILVSSEVGSEGLDFEFCHILFNYDLPWNPMVVEQRIGRLDRITQKSERIIIFNFSMPGTIEDRILHRLYERIRIFQDSIGDLEAILGEQIRNMTADLLRSRLTPAEQEARIDQVAEVIERQRQQIKDLEKQSGRFMGHDDFFSDEISRITRLKRYVTYQELEIFLREFLRVEYPACLLEPIDGGGLFRLRVTDALEDFVRRSSEEGDLLLHQFLQRSTKGRVTVTFQSDLAAENPDVEFFAAHHPLIKAVKHYYDLHLEQLHPVARIRLEGAPVNGQFLYRIYLVEMKGARRRKTLETAFAEVGTERVLDGDTSEILLSEMVTRGRTLPDFPAIEKEMIRKLCMLAEEEFVSRLSAQEQELTRSNEALINNRLASLEASYRAREAKQLKRHQSAMEKQQSHRYIRMVEGGLRNMKNEYARKREEIEEGRSVGKSFRLVAAGFLEATA